MHAGRNSVIGTVTRHGLGDLGIESWWVWDFLHPSKLVLRATQPPVQRVLGLFIWVVQVAGAWHWLPTSSSAKVKVRVSYTSTPLLDLHGLF